MKVQMYEMPFIQKSIFFLLLFGTGIIFWVGPSLLMIGVQEFGNDFLSRNDFWTGLSWKAMEKTAGVPEKNIEKKLELFLKNEKKKQARKCDVGNWIFSKS